MHQSKYIHDLTLLDTNDVNSNNRNEKITGQRFEDLRSCIGQLCWASNQTRPDASFDVCQLSVALKNATNNDVIYANKCMKRLKNNELCLVFSYLGDISKASIVVFTDASFANLADCGSQGGVIIFLLGENGLASPLYWESKKLKRVVKSTSSAETVALLAGCEMAFLLNSLLLQLIGTSLPITAVTDCKNLKNSVYSSKTIEDKRMKVDVCVLRDYIRKGQLSDIKWVDTDSQLADGLTKKGVNLSKLYNALGGHSKLLC